MRTSLSDLAILDIVDPIRVLNGREAMRNSDSRATLRSVVQSSLHDLLGGRIERGSSLIEQQDLRVPQQRTGNRNTFYIPNRLVPLRSKTNVAHLRFWPPDSWLPLPPTSVSKP